MHYSTADYKRPITKWSSAASKSILGVPSGLKLIKYQGDANWLKTGYWYKPIYLSRKPPFLPLFTNSPNIYPKNPVSEHFSDIGLLIFYLVINTPLWRIQNTKTISMLKYHSFQFTFSWLLFCWYFDLKLKSKM